MDLIAARLPLAGLLLGMLALPLEAREPPTHCGATEVVVFSCQIGERVASLCASSDLAEAQGQLTYRFGRINRVELAYPSANTKPQQAFTYQVLPKGDYVRFSNEGVTYVVFSEMRPPTGDVEGVVVARPGRKPQVLGCRSGGLGPQGWTPVYKAKLPRDPEIFDIPR